MRLACKADGAGRAGKERANANHLKRDCLHERVVYHLTTEQAVPEDYRHL